MTRLRDEDGATLILALFFATAIAIVIVALAGLAFTSQKAANVYAQRGKLVDALDGGVQGAVENARLRDPQGCPDDPVVLTGADAINGVGVHVGCADSAGVLTFTATGICPPPPADTSAVGIVATATLSTIGGPHGPPIARLTSWRTVPNMPCTTP